MYNNNKKNISYIYFNIKNYSKIDDVISIIKLIDNSICIQDNILETNAVIAISRSINLSYDYVFSTSILCDNDTVNKYFQDSNKLKMILKKIITLMVKIGILILH